MSKPAINKPRKYDECIQCRTDTACVRVTLGAMIVVVCNGCLQHAAAEAHVVLGGKEPTA